MERNRTGEGARALLFERLADDEPRARTELYPFRTHSPDGLKASVLRRLDLLLNTRATRPRPEGIPLTVLDFGLPDFSAMYGRDPGARSQLAREIRRSIQAFEPRLQVAGVTVAPSSENDHALQVAVTGTVRIGHVTESVSFSIPLSGEGTAQESL